MINDSFYYKESGKIDFFWHSVSYSLLIFVIVILALVYNYCLVLFPLVYFNVIVCIGFSIAFSISLLITARFARNRNSRSLKTQAVVAVCIGFYCQWTAYLVYAKTGQLPSFSEYLSELSWVFSPSTNLQVLAYSYKNGFEFGFGSIFGIEVKGLFALLLWLSEAAILMIAPLVVIAKRKIYPFSEATDKWYPKFTLSRDFETIVVDQQFIQSLLENPMETIGLLDKGDAIRHCKIHVFYTKEEEDQYLTFERVSIEGQGRGAKDKEILINNFKINRRAAEQILNKFPHKAERLSVF